MPTASVTSPMIPPSASTSRTRCPLAIPPTAGLHDICAIKSTLSVNNAVLSPMREQATAASQPACPAPTTATSYVSVNWIPKSQHPVTILSRLCEPLCYSRAHDLVSRDLPVGD